MSDSADINGCLKGRENETRILYDKYWKLVYNISLRYIYNKSDAQDLFQEAFINIFSGLKGFNSSKGTLSQWLSGVTVKTAFKYNKKNYKVEFKTLDDVEEIVEEELLVE